MILTICAIVISIMSDLKGPTQATIMPGGDVSSQNYHVTPRGRVIHNSRLTYDHIIKKTMHDYTSGFQSEVHQVKVISMTLQVSIVYNSKVNLVYINQKPISSASQAQGVKQQRKVKQ